MNENCEKQELKRLKREFIVAIFIMMIPIAHIVARIVNKKYTTSFMILITQFIACGICVMITGYKYYQLKKNNKVVSFISNRTEELLISLVGLLAFLTFVLS